MSWINVEEEKPKLKHMLKNYELVSDSVLIRIADEFHVAKYSEYDKWLLNSTQNYLHGVEEWKKIS